MRNLLKKFLCVTLCAMLLCMGLPMYALADTADDTVKVLAIGHSYAVNANEYISRIADSMGIKVSVTTLYDDGCPIDRHVKWYNTEAKEYEFYVDSVNVSYPNKNTMQEVFERDDYDYITIQQGPAYSPIFSTYWTEEEPWLTELYDIIKRHEPQAELMIHQTWSFCEEVAKNGNQYTSITYPDSKDMYEKIVDAYEQAADMLGIDKETGIIPAGKAVQLAKDEYGYGDFYNKAPLDSCANGALYNDNISHLNTRGRYLAACVWVEKIFGADCRKATYYPTDLLTAEDCAILRDIAHEAVTGEKAYIEDDWRVLPDGEGVEIVHYMGTVDNEVGTLVVPDTINGKKVTRVDDTAFKYIDGLQSLILPDDVTIVYEEGALDNYNIIEKVWDGTSVKPTKGEGTETSPYLIENGSHLYWAVTNKNTGVYFKLTRDILINNIIVDTENGTVKTAEDVHEWYTDGANESVVFEGIIDGDFHVIRGLYIDEDFGAETQQWKIGAGLIARGGNGMMIKNLGIDNSFIKAVNGSASAFVGTTGSSNSVDLGFENSFIGEDVYIYGTNAGGFIGAGNGSGYVSGVTDCYCLGTVEASGSFFGAVTGGVWSCANYRVTNFYATKVRLYGQNGMPFTDCYAPAKKADYDNMTVVAESDMKGQTAMTKLAGLSDAFTLPSNGYPVLKAWVGKSDDVWSGFAINTLTGDGTENSPYLISDGEGLAYAILSGGKGKYYKLTNDIYLNDINGVNWETAEAIGNYAPSEWIDGVTFTGYFDGDSHIVYGIYYHIGNGRELTESGYAGLFPSITRNTHIVNVGVRYSYIEIFGRSAAIVGFIVRDDKNENILIDSCFSDETVYVNHIRLYEATGVCSGGILGATLFTPNVTISNCYSLANLLGPYSKNKIVGSTWMMPESFVASNCYGDGSLWLCSSSGNALKTGINSYSTVAPGTAVTNWTQLTKAEMQGLNVFDNMPLGDAFMATAGYPVLKVFVNLEYVVDGETVKEVTGEDADVLTAFIPEAPAGKYFAGWYTDEECTNAFVTNEIPLGKTKVYAKLKDFNTYVKDDFDSFVGSASYYQLFDDGTTATKFDRYGWTIKENENGIDYYYSNRTWAQGGSVLLMNEDGSLFVADPTKKYTITVKYKVESLAKEGSSIYLSAGAGVDPSIYKDITDTKFKINASGSLTLTAVNDEWQIATFELDLSKLDSKYISAMGIHIICLGGVGETNSNTILVEGSAYNKIAIDYVEINCETPPVEETIIGDVNGDGNVDTTDLASLKLNLAGLSSEIGKGADLNGDGNVDTTDLASLKLALAGLLDLSGTTDTRLNVLGLGNSFTVDGMQYLWNIADSAGEKDLLVAKAQIGGSSLDTHWTNIQGNSAAYEFTVNDDGDWNNQANNSAAKLSDVLSFADWDVIVIQQVSQSSGKNNTYGNLQNIINYIKEKCPNAKIMWQMTWAYQADSTHSGFPAYNNNQMTMYNAIVDTTQEVIVPNSDIVGIIPSGTAIQNLRTSLGDNLTRDGYHLSLDYGRYCAAMTWYKAITGKNIDYVNWLPEDYQNVGDNLSAIKTAVNEAVAKPFEVTDISK